MTVNVFEPIDTDEIGTSRSYWVGQRLDISHPIEFYSLTIDPGYIYLLRAVTVQWNTLSAGVRPAPCPELALEFLAMSSIFPRQSSPVLASLLTTPAGRNLVYPLTQPNGQVSMAPAGPINWPRGSRKILNFAFIENDTLQIKVSGQTLQGGTWTPGYVDLVLEGYNIPEKSMSIWGGASD